MKTIKQIALDGLRHIEKYHRNDRDYAQMISGHEYIRDNPHEFTVVDLWYGETRLIAKADSLTLFDPLWEKPPRRIEP